MGYSAYVTNQQNNKKSYGLDCAFYEPVYLSEGSIGVLLRPEREVIAGNNRNFVELCGGRYEAKPKAKTQ